MALDLATLLANLSPGTFHVVVTTPLGSESFDPASTTPAWWTPYVSLAIRPGPPTEEELAQPSLTSNLLALGALAVGGVVLWTRRSTRRSRR